MQLIMQGRLTARETVRLRGKDREERGRCNGNGNGNGECDRGEGTREHWPDGDHEGEQGVAGRMTWRHGNFLHSHG
jgi:hypothetical protein